MKSKKILPFLTCVCVDQSYSEKRPVRCTNLGAKYFQKMKQPYIHTQVQLDRILRIDIKTKTSLFVCFFSRNSDFASKRLISPKSLETPELI